MTHPLIRDLRTIPNLVSLSRIVLIFIAVWLFVNDHKAIGTVLGVTAGLTDYLDGILARRLGQVTHLGAILDQFSDLVFEAAAILILVLEPGGPPPIVLYIYLLREFWVGTIRRFMEAAQITIHSSFIGKLKTNFLGWSFMFWALHLIDAVPQAGWLFFALACTGLYGGLVWSYLSAWSYTRQFYAGYAEMRDSPGQT